jgi:hypothetical protein
MHKSNFHVTWFSYGSNTRDAVGRVFCSQADFNVDDTAASSWILAAIASRWILAVIASRWILAAIASNRASKPEFQHSPTFRLGILAIVVGTSTWRASLTVGNASIDDTDAATTFFFVTDGKTYICAFQFICS